LFMDPPLNDRGTHNPSASAGVAPTLWTRVAPEGLYCVDSIPASRILGIGWHHGLASRSG
jgi:hypothetical protein